MLALDDYWSEMGGIYVRIEMFGEQLQYKTYNQSIVITASSVGVFNLKMVGPLDERTCDWCAEHVGRVYRSNQSFLPVLPKHPNCFLPETKIVTEHGLKQIQDIKVGDRVYTHLGRLRKVTKIHRNWHEGELIQINENSLTLDHPVLTPEGWVRADSLKDSTPVLTLPSTIYTRSYIIPTIKRLGSIYNGWVYNLSVDEDESYAVGEDGFIVHNCRHWWDIEYLGEGPQKRLKREK